MFQRKGSWLFSLIIGLAIFGFAISVFKDPTTLIMNLVVSLLIGTAIFALIYYFFIRKRTTSNNELKKYRQAVKQSKQKYSKKPQRYQPSKSSPLRRKALTKTKASRKNAPQLRVIDGNKQKKKNRASL